VATAPWRYFELFEPWRWAFLSSGLNTYHSANNGCAVAESGAARWIAGLGRFRKIFSRHFSRRESRFFLTGTCPASWSPKTMTSMSPASTDFIFSWRAFWRGCPPAVGRWSAQSYMVVEPAHSARSENHSVTVLQASFEQPRVAPAIVSVRKSRQSSECCMVVMRFRNIAAPLEALPSFFRGCS